MKEGRKIKGNLWQEFCIFIHGIFGVTILILWLMFFIGSIAAACFVTHNYEIHAAVVTVLLFASLVCSIFAAYYFWHVTSNLVNKQIVIEENNYRYSGARYLIKADSQGNVLEYDSEALIKDGHEIISVLLPRFYESMGAETESISHELKVNYEDCEIIIKLHLNFKIDKPFDMQEVYAIFKKEQINQFRDYFIKQMEIMLVDNYDLLTSYLGEFVKESNKIYRLVSFLKHFKLENEFSNVEIMGFKADPKDISFMVKPKEKKE